MESITSLHKTTDHSNDVGSFLEWEHTIQKANHAFESGHLIQANFLYESSIAKAKYLFKNRECSRDSVATILVSYHNLSDFHLHNNNKTNALDCLQEAIACLSNKLETSSIDIQSEAALMWGLALANQQMWSFKK
jgi:hypothetical protein